MTWFIHIADVNYEALGVTPEVIQYLKSLPNWERGKSVEIIKQFGIKDIGGLQRCLEEYKFLLDNYSTSIAKRFIPQVFRWMINNSLRLPEDFPRLRNALMFFSNNFNKLEKKNINMYPTFNDLEDIVQTKNESNRQSIKNVKMQGSKDVYADKEWRVIEMTTPEAVCELGKGTRWCTNSDNEGYETAESYLKSGPLYLILHNSGKWEKYAQCTKSFDQFMDVKDRKITNPPDSLVSVIKNLINQGVFNKQHFFEEFACTSNYAGVDKDLTNWFLEDETERDGDFPKVVYGHILQNIRDFKRRLPVFEDKVVFSFIESDKNQIKNKGFIDGDRIETYFNYSHDYLGYRKKWDNEKQENFIAKTSFAFEYWKDYYGEYNFGENKPGKGDFQRWPQYEKEMFSNPKRMEEMVGYVWFLNGNKRAGPKVESYLLSSAQETKVFDYCYEYAKNCQMRWPELENIILKGNHTFEIACYAEEVLKGRWPEAEPILLQEPYAGYLYARSVIRGRWPELEKVIMDKRDGATASFYAINILKQRWPEMEKYILNYGIDYIGSSYRKHFEKSIEGDLAGEKKAQNLGWYKLSQIEIKSPIDGAGHMTSDDLSLIFEALYNGDKAGYALIVIPKGKEYSYVGQVTVRPEYRLKGIATALYNNIDSYLAINNLPHLRPSRDLSPGSRRIWDKRLATPNRNII